MILWLVCLFLTSWTLTYGVSLHTLYISSMFSLPWHKWGTGCVEVKLGLTRVCYNYCFMNNIFWVYPSATYRKKLCNYLKEINLLDWQDQISHYNMDATRSYLEISAIAIVICIASYIIVLFRLAKFVDYSIWKIG